MAITGLPWRSPWRRWPREAPRRFAMPNAPACPTRRFTTTWPASPNAERFAQSFSGTAQRELLGSRTAPIAIVADDFPAEENVFHLRTAADVVHDQVAARFR